MTDNQPIQELSSYQHSTEADDLRETQIPWLGKIPAHWTVSKVKWQFDVQLGKMLDEKDISGDNLAPYLRNKDVQWWDINTEDLPQMDFDPAEKRKYNLRSGDVLVCEGGEIGRSAVWTNDEKECYYQKALHRVRPLSSDQSAEFFCYFMQFAAANGIFTANTNRSTIDHLTATKLKNQEIPIPPKREQESIATFLDHRTSRINALVEKQKRLLDLFRERRNSIVTTAVCKGLKSERSFKPSGIDGVGKIPANWDTRKLKWLLQKSPKNGISPPIESESEGIPTFSISTVGDGEVSVMDDLKYVDISEEKARNYSISEGDILMIRGNGNPELVGKCGIVTPPIPDGCIYPDILIKIKFHPQLSAKFFVYLLNSPAIRPQIEIGAKTSTGLWKVSQSTVSNIRVPCPPISEQEDIVEHIESVNSKIDRLTRKTQQSIDLLKEKRQALITAAVTGQIDVTEGRGETHATHR